MVAAMLAALLTGTTIGGQAGATEDVPAASPAGELVSEPGIGTPPPLAPGRGGVPSEQVVSTDETPLSADEVERETNSLRERLATDDAVLASLFEVSPADVRASYPDLVDEVARRLEIQESADAWIAEAQAHAGDRYAGAYIDRATGELILQLVDVTQQDRDAISKEGEARLEEVSNSRAELEAVQAEIEARLDGEAPVRMLGVDDSNNRVIIGVLEGQAEAVSPQRLGVDADQVRIVEMSDPDEQAGGGGEEIPFHPVPSGFGGKSCTLTASAKSVWAGSTFYYWLTAGHCRVGNSQAPNSRQFKQPGGAIVSLWQWQDSGCCDVAKVWVNSNQVRSRLTTSSADAGSYANARIKGYNRVGNAQFSSVCFTGHGFTLPSGSTTNHRCGVTICSACDAISSGVTMTNQFWWSVNNCGFTVDGDSGGPLYFNYSNGVDLISIHQGSVTLSGGACGSYNEVWAFGSRMDHSVPAIGVTLLTS